MQSLSIFKSPTNPHIYTPLVFPLCKDNQVPSTIIKSKIHYVSSVRTLDFLYVLGITSKLYCEV
ncbi:hypothetical protein SLEP1_g32633 [Rubroshorea leprosula]|uniref:Uncharacterized protein n=1 Tax=Rubroshorea leprosula TaxID=152421 RepID=A0AAV5KE02_9ROSI|nr:hypothetical protein SLEP1_g32633 [Rubroshorea leprosula]